MPQNDPVTGNSDITNRDIVTATPVNDKTDILSPKPKKEQDKAAKPKVAKLFIYDASLGNDEATAIRDAFYGGAKLVPINEWSDLVSELSKYSEINTLVLDTHSIPGNLLIGGTSPSTQNQQSRLAATGVTVTNQIIFEGCSIMGHPADTAKIIFGIAGSKTKATGYTFFSVVSSFEVDLVGNEDEDVINSALQPFREYLLPGSPTAKSLVGKKGPVKFYRRWFRRDLDETLPENETDPRAIKKRSELTRIRVRNETDAQSVRSEYESPIEPGYIVTIEDIQAVQSK
ncbi:hypothetical protein [Nitrosomonas sp.]|uniref:hypothetical protein n=1 Tax=Nitrosomonas sp. TaxID=42353 RepID=UPI002083CEB3|nr:hypothetical protein [Nitrosomonas sp.]GJL74135.1 MAG: hypothetical protein NMNS02_02410 [Nitrosomonas sp.]